jgi:hypothetical protein
MDKLAIATFLAEAQDWEMRTALYNKEQLGPLPIHRIKRVDKPTTIITDAVQRIDMRNTAYGLAARGEYGPVVQKGVQKSLPGKYPLSAAQKDVIDHISLIKPNSVATKIAPIPQDPEVLTRHIKAAGYFLKADVMGTCKVPESAYYSHDKHMHSRLAQQIAIRAAYLLGPGKDRPDDKWWFDMEYVDDVIRSCD